MTISSTCPPVTGTCLVSFLQSSYLFGTALRPSSGLCFLLHIHCNFQTHKTYETCHSMSLPCLFSTSHLHHVIRPCRPTTSLLAQLQICASRLQNRMPSGFPRGIVRLHPYLLPPYYTSMLALLLRVNFITRRTLQFVPFPCHNYSERWTSLCSSRLDRKNGRGVLCSSL